jgi:SAM-dependent methyltransferase
MALNTRYADDTYFKETKTWHSEDAHWKASHILGGLKAIATPITTMADIGCGSGDVLALLADALPDTQKLTGWELAPNAYELTKRHQNKKLTYLNDLMTNHPDAIYDVLLVLDVFEHIDDYIGFLRSIKPHAKDFVFHIPLDASARNILAENHILRYKREKIGHLHYFTKYTALATLEDCGYKIKLARLTHSKIQPPAASLKGRIKQGLHKILYAVNNDFYARSIGGCSLLVLASAD